ncbi:Uncharacterized protein HZ326_6036, partial [Fusarium oxysporum f. sp. albedinis]
MDPRTPRCHHDCLLLDTTGADLALLTNVELNSALRTVPLSRSGRYLFEADTFEVKPFLLTLLVCQFYVCLLLACPIIVPKLTLLQRQYFGSSGSIGFPSSSTSSSSTSTDPLSFFARAFF